MTSSPPPRQRRTTIRELLAARPFHSQADLAEALAALDIHVNQATLSRDLREIGVVKGPGGYALPESAVAAARGAGGGNALERALALWLRRATPAANQVVLATPPGGAQPLGLAVDRARLPGVVGTIAGDDTVLMICTDKRRAARIAADLEQSLQS